MCVVRVTEVRGGNRPFDQSLCAIWGWRVDGSAGASVDRGVRQIMGNRIKRSRARKAFTLVELLVVVSVLAVLIAILMPSLSKAREGAKRTACGGNLHAIGQGLNMYLIDSNDFLPVVAELPSYSVDEDNPRPSIAQVLLPYIQKDAEGMARVDSANANINENDNSSYLNRPRPKNVFQCPSDLPGRGTNGKPRPSPNTGKSYYQSEGSSYEFNTRLYRFNASGGMFHDDNEFQDPVKLSEVVRSERAQHIFGGQAAVEEIWLLKDYIAFHGKPGTQGACNYMYVDGRVGDLRR